MKARHLTCAVLNLATGRQQLDADALGAYSRAHRTVARQASHVIENCTRCASVMSMRFCSPCDCDVVLVVPPSTHEEESDL